jgi:polysaccharide export outer membrane protein
MKPLRTKPWLQIAFTMGALRLTCWEASAFNDFNPYRDDAKLGATEQGAADAFAPTAEQKTSIIASPTVNTGAGDPSIRQAADTLAAEVTPGGSAYKIGPLDVLDVSVFQVPELSKTVEVAYNGTVDLPLLGETPAAGKSTYELQHELNAKLGAKYLQNPQVTVTVKQYNSSRVTISGAVKSPGVFAYKGETLLQYISMAGGLSGDANSMVLVLRQEGGKRSAAKFDISDIQSGRVGDPSMHAGDLIVAQTSLVKRGMNNVLAPILKVLPLAAFAGL